MDDPEDTMTTAVLMDTAAETGLEVDQLLMTEIGWDHTERCFVDRRHRRIQTLFKLYPWEWILRERFCEFALETYDAIHWIEPIWKMVLSNKAILAILWEMYPDHPNLLPAYLDGPRELTEYVRKPFLGREGRNVSIVTPRGTLELDGPYGDGPSVYQQYAPMPQFEGNHSVLGTWIIDDEVRGMGVRESDGPITEDLARFVPHYFLNPLLTTNEHTVI
jgi:glutathionylspermidine synthase